MKQNCVDCKQRYPGYGSRCPACYVKFTLKRKVKRATIKEVLDRMKLKEGCDTKLATTILQEGE